MAAEGTTGALRALADPDAWPGIAAALGDWVPVQRWFQGKARIVTGLRVGDAAVLEAEPPLLLVLADVAYSAGPAERYQIPLVAARGGTPAAVTVAGLALADALDDPAASRALAALATRSEPVPTALGVEIVGAPLPPAPPRAAGRRANGPPLPAGPSRRLGVEQSNSSVVLGETMILKVFRRLEGGLNPDVEVTRRLTEAGFAHVPSQHGAILLRDRAPVSEPPGRAQARGTPDRAPVSEPPGRAQARGSPSDQEQALAVLSAYARGARDGWELACAEAERVIRGEAGGDLASDVRDLGATVARLHAALRDAFGETRADAGSRATWAEAMQTQARTVLAAARARAPAATAALADVAAALHERLGAVAGPLEGAVPLVRTHGDLHLGQVLADEHAGWLVVDFEGEPARPLAERRRPHNPLRDVAGMLRSFDYAAAHVARDVPPALAAWRDRLRTAFWDGYAPGAQASGLLAPAATTATLLDAFELDKAVYEVGYELANRPEWVRIPVAGILRVLESKEQV